MLYFQKITFGKQAGVRMLLAVMCSLVLSVSTHGQSALQINQGNVKVTLNGYADFGYAVGPQRAHKYKDFISGDTLNDFGRRDFTSYPLYVNQFSLSLAYIQAQLDYGDKFRFRVALHAGHIPDALTFAEHPSLRNVREAAVLYRLNDRWSVEAGIFPSYFGSEVPLNKENLHATRGYIADFAPDYESGIRLAYSRNPAHTFTAMLLNGWQEIRDGNGTKALALSYAINKPGKITGNWNVYLGDERAFGGPFSQWRMYHNIYARLFVGEKWLLLPAFDWVIQEKAGPQKGLGADGYQQVLGLAFSARYALHKHHGIAVRYDHVHNPQDIVEELRTNSPNGWRSCSGTLTYEFVPIPQFTWRVEGRYGLNKDAVFRNANNGATRADWYAITTAAFPF